MRSTFTAKSLLTEPERHHLHPPQEVVTLGSTLVFAPHPDDETLGCGGLLALLADADLPARVIVMTDGSRSHLHSLTHPPARLAALREQETLEALQTLGLPVDAADFLRFPDCGLPEPDTVAFQDATMCLLEVIVARAPETILVPWRRDPHCDHEATYRLLRAAVRKMEHRPRWLEYPVWAWPQAETDLAPRDDEGCAWRLDITPVLQRKIEAIGQHRSQLGKLIHDDESGFVLQPEMLAYFQRSWELYFEPNDV